MPGQTRKKNKYKAPPGYTTYTVGYRTLNDLFGDMIKYRRSRLENEIIAMGLHRDKRHKCG